MASAFLNNPNNNLFPSTTTTTTTTNKPDLVKLMKLQEETTLKFQLCIGQQKTTPQVAITGMVVELHNNHKGAADDYCVSLPGTKAKGHHHRRRLEVLHQGSFVSLLGTQYVEMIHGCWEMSWDNNAKGKLVCGLEIPRAYKRNAAVSLNKGIIYLSFPLYSAKSIETIQKRQQAAKEAAQRFLKERDQELEKFDLTQNPLQKAWHLRNAFVAVEKYTEHIAAACEDTSPPDQKDLVSLPGGLLVGIKGVIWEKSKPQGIGYATIIPEVKRGWNRLRP